ncbi:hypothetical protein KKH65_02360, partial [bacterium]|nr:hypothetical protein [bacterium]
LYLSDTISLFFLAACFYFFTRFYFKKRLTDLWFSVGFAGISTLIRPTGLFWIAPCLFLVLIFTQKTLTKRLIGMLGCIVIFFGMLFPWMLRNQQVGAGFRLDTNIGNTLYYYNCAATVSVVTGESAEKIRQRWRAETEKEFSLNGERYPDENSQVNYKLAKAKAVISKYPLTYLKLHLQPWTLLPDVTTFFELLGLTQTGRGTLDILTRKGLICATKHYFGEKIWLLFLALPLLFIVFLTYLGCAIQLCLWVVQKNWFLFFFFLAFVGYYLVLPGPITMPRYQLPALPLMTIMSGMAIMALYKRVVTIYYK